MAERHSLFFFIIIGAETGFRESSEKRGPEKGPVTQQISILAPVGTTMRPDSRLMVARRRRKGWWWWCVLSIIDGPHETWRFNWLPTDGPTNGPTDGPTNGPTDGRMDTPSYRDARTHLKIGPFDRERYDYCMSFPLRASVCGRARGPRD